MQIHVHRLSLESMRERQNRKRRIFLAELKMIRRIDQIRNHVCMSQHYAFRLARGSRGVDDRREIHGPRCRRQFAAECGFIRDNISTACFKIGQTQKVRLARVLTVKNYVVRNGFTIAQYAFDFS